MSRCPSTKTYYFAIREKTIKKCIYAPSGFEFQIFHNEKYAAVKLGKCRHVLKKCSNTAAKSCCLQI